MTDLTLNRFLATGTNAERLAFTPSPPTPASGPDPGYLWCETDTETAWGYNTATSTWFVIQGSTAWTAITSMPDAIGAIDGLTPAADRLAYYTGAATAALATFTAAGRALVDDASASDQLTTLGVSAFAKTILDDADAAAVRTTIGAIGALTLASTVTQSGTPVATSVGFLGSPQISDQDDYTLALTDAGGHYYHVSGSTHTLTIPANASVAFPIGTVIGIVNENGGGNVTIAITSDTLRWTDQTGSRTLAANGTATLLKVTSTVWRLTGDGIT